MNAASQHSQAPDTWQLARLTSAEAKDVHHWGTLPPSGDCLVAVEECDSNGGDAEQHGHDREDKRCVYFVQWELEVFINCRREAKSITWNTWLALHICVLAIMWPSSSVPLIIKLLVHLLCHHTSINLHKEPTETTRRMSLDMLHVLLLTIPSHSIPARRMAGNEVQLEVYAYLVSAHKCSKIPPVFWGLQSDDTAQSDHPWTAQSWPPLGGQSHRDAHPPAKLGVAYWACV